MPCASPLAIGQSPGRKAGINALVSFAFTAIQSWQGRRAVSAFRTSQQLMEWTEWGALPTPFQPSGAEFRMPETRLTRPLAVGRLDLAICEKRALSGYPTMRWPS